MTPELNWCGQPMKPGESYYGGKPENIPNTIPPNPAAKQHKHYEVITEEDLAELFGRGEYTLTKAEAAKLLRELTGNTQDNRLSRTTTKRTLCPASAQ